MTESPRPSAPRITVLPVQPGDPPFRIVEIDGEVIGSATDMTDVLIAASAAGIRVHDLDDPAVVRWVGGGKLTWKPR
ncbi:hypothetical protein B046DRAFT_05495 [Streptomyces sp. LamerLS-316]|uniref:hypothetical protein n=1 Tax=unclassified Streptomyces TaxID=2593676 RepID=UPI0008239076|nr:MULTISPECIES: hypothetical protein [unclassified Streptomyces]MYQ36838.1 hypothetical protein [Streptomyces sp. SID4921]SCK51416.1 hypothetical protein B046DRAFT_05495 [Streptomyces sp. LamerLS-316]